MTREWVYIPENEEEQSIRIGYTIPARDPGVAAVLIELPIVTRDPEQAEEWRQALARGDLPRWRDGSPAIKYRGEPLTIEIDEFEFLTDA